MALNFNTNPYYDDFDENKNFHRILFRPGRAVQARELTQSQTILQNQIDRFGKHVFKEGSRVTGGETFDETVVSVKLQSTFGGTTIDISGYDGYFALANSSNAIYKIKKAEVANTTDPNTLFLSYIKTANTQTANSNGAIANSETLKIYSTGDLSSSNLVGNVITSATESSYIGRLFSIAEGTFFTNGAFVRNDAQTVVVSKYSNNANVTVGFDVTESIVSSTNDTSLLDPAVGASNYIAPGADRYKIALTLSAKGIDASESIPSLTSSKYIEIARYREGQLVRDTRTSVYSVLSDTLARRTYDESGNYKVNGLDPKVNKDLFSDANTNFLLEISPGKAYVLGYETETIGKTFLAVEKARETETVSGYDVPAYYGNYFYVTSANGEVFNFSTATKLEIHSNNGNFGASTKIAEAYPRNIEYVSGNGSASVYKLQLFNIVKTSNTPIDLANTIIAGNTTSVNGTCNVHSSSIITRTLTGAYSSANPLINLSSSTGVTVGMAVSNPNAAEIRFPTYVTAINGNQITISQAPTGSNGAATLSFRSAYLTDTNYDSSVFEGSYDVVKEFSQVNYYTKRVFKSVSFTAGVGSVQTNDGTERFASATGGNKQENYAICIRTPGSAYSRGQWVDLSSNTYFTIPSPSVGSPATLNINLADTGFNGTADILTTIDITAATRRTKTLVTGVRKFINQYTANTLSLGYADVINVSAIYISDSTTNSANANANVNVVGSFTIDYGQRDGFYDHATIKVNNNATVNSGNVLIIFDRYSHSGTGFFDTLSYPTYNTIPTYTKTDGTVIDLRDSIDFRPIRVTDISSNVYSNLAISFSSQQIVDSVLGAVDTNVEYYLARTDKVVLKKNGDFKVLQGVSALTNPPVPNDETDAMTLYTLTIDPYTYGASNVKVKIENNRRYTMRDIGSIDNRLTKVEYYTALNLLEKDIASTTYYDDQNNLLFNNGFVVDSFRGHGVGDVFSPDYKCSIDYDNEILRPRFESNATSLILSSNTLTSTGNLITLTYNTVPYITQNVASQTVNVNPFNVIGFIGYVKLEKDVATWVDFSTRPDVVVNDNNNLDNYLYSNNFSGSRWNDWVLLSFVEDTNIVYTYYSTSGRSTQITNDSRVKQRDTAVFEDKLLVYNRSNTLNFEIFGIRPNTKLEAYLDSILVSGYLRSYNVTSSSYTTEALFSDSNGYAKGQLIIPNDDYFKFTVGKNHIYFCDNGIDKTKATTIAETFFYSAEPPVIKPPEPIRETPQSNLPRDIGGSGGGSSGSSGGSNTCPAPWMRILLSDKTWIKAGNLKPGMKVLTKHENTLEEGVFEVTYASLTTAKRLLIKFEDIDLVVSDSHKFYIDGNWVVANDIQKDDIINGKRVLSVEVESENAEVVHITVDDAHTYNVEGFLSHNKSPPPPPPPDVSGPYKDSSEPTHSLNTGIAITTLQTNGGRLGGSEDWKSAVRDATGSEPAAVSQATAATNAQNAVSLVQSLYDGLGRGNSIDLAGFNYWQTVAASPGVSAAWVTSAFAAAAKTNGECFQGDPLAQTFFVNKFTNPNGIFVSSIDLYFATKSTTGIPVTVELRPTVNGYPDSSKIIPGSQVTLNPSNVNLPVTANVPVATRFTFDSPIYLEPNEYSFVVMANSDEYTVYIGTIGQNRIDGTGPIVSQPYVGSFFKSQNASTWTPEQESDICFVLNKCEFTVNTNQTAVLTPVALGYDQLYDVARVNIPYQSLSSAANISFQLATKNNGAAVLSDYVGIIPNSNIILDQRKIANTATDSNVKITMTTTNTDISPYVDVSRSNYVVIKNLIDSASAANVVSYPETLSSGGGALSKYLLRKVTLNDGFDASALRVYLQQNLPQGSSIQVYYRAVAATDSDKIENKPWILMTQTGVSSVNQNASEYYDYEYKVNNVTYTSSGVTYTNFRTFAIKIVFFSTNPAAAPTVKNLRAIALS